MSDTYLGSTINDLNISSPDNADSIGTAAAALRQIKRFIKSEDTNCLTDYIKQVCFKSIYDVGDIYVTLKNDNPSVRFGGTWEKIEGRILFGSGFSTEETVFPITNTDLYNMHNHVELDWSFIPEPYFSYSEVKTNSTSPYDTTLVISSSEDLYNQTPFKISSIINTIPSDKLKITGTLAVGTNELGISGLVNDPLPFNFYFSKSPTDFSTSTILTSGVLKAGNSFNINYEVNSNNLTDFTYLVIQPTKNWATKSKFLLNLRLDLQVVFTLNSTTKVTIENNSTGNLYLPYLGCNIWKKLSN